MKGILSEEKSLDLGIDVGQIIERRKIMPLAAWIWVWGLRVEGTHLGKHTQVQIWPEAKLLIEKLCFRICSVLSTSSPFSIVGHPTSILTHHQIPTPLCCWLAALSSPQSYFHSPLLPRYYLWLLAFFSFQLSVLRLCQDLSSFLHLKFLS